jgi:heme/copper-type cytochrome/quinol oxidase subunit 2
MEGIIVFSNRIMLLVVFIVFFIGAILMRCVYLFIWRGTGRTSERFVHSSGLEFVWAVSPSFMLLDVSIPSFSLLYAIDEISLIQGTLKCIGHQWFWLYEYVGDFLG